MRLETDQELRHFIVENFLFGLDNGLKNADSFLEKGIIDSTGILELITYVETQYAIQVDGDELIPENFDSIDRLASFIKRKVNGENCILSSVDDSSGQGAMLQAKVNGVHFRKT